MEVGGGPSSILQTEGFIKTGFIKPGPTLVIPGPRGSDTDLDTLTDLDALQGVLLTRPPRHTQPVRVGFGRFACP